MRHDVIQHLLFLWDQFQHVLASVIVTLQLRAASHLDLLDFDVLHQSLFLAEQVTQHIVQLTNHAIDPLTEPLSCLGFLDVLLTATSGNDDFLQVSQVLCKGGKEECYMDALDSVQDWHISIESAMEILQSCSKLATKSHLSGTQTKHFYCFVVYVMLCYLVI